MCRICDGEGCVNCDPGPGLEIEAGVCRYCGDPDCNGYCYMSEYDFEGEGFACTRCGGAGCAKCESSE